MREGEPRKGDRVQWRDLTGTVTDDYWRARDRYSVQFDGMKHTLDFGAEALTKIVRPRCRYCQNGAIAGLPGNACENCFNTGYDDAGPEDLI